MTVAAGGEAGAACRHIACAIDEAVSPVPDRNPSGASVVLTIDNSVGSLCGVQVSGSYSGLAGARVNEVTLEDTSLQCSACGEQVPVSLNFTRRACSRCGCSWPR